VLPSRASKATTISRRAHRVSAPERAAVADLLAGGRHGGGKICELAVTRSDDTGSMAESRDRLARAGSSANAVVLAVTTDDDRYAATRAEATRIAAEEHGRLILYDWDAATVLGAPLPSEWSGEGTADDVPSELDEQELEAAGRAKIAAQVAQARQAGVPATAWLPSKPGAEPLAVYARDHGVGTIVVPRDLEAAGELERLATATSDPAEGVREQADARVVLVPSDGGGGSGA
jgi:hypothetical protein